jgi:signal transduction histidine kinase/CheY-like chemotaxis protein
VARVWTCADAGQRLELMVSATDPLWPEPPPLEAFEVRKAALLAAPRSLPEMLTDALLSSCGPGAFAALPLRGPAGTAGVLALFFPSMAPPGLDELLEPACEALGAGLLQARSLEEAETQREQAAADGRRKDEFLAMLAHELRNPLAPIVTALGLLRTRDSDAQFVARQRALVERQVGQLSRLVDDLLDVSRVARGKLELRKEPVELASVVSRAVEAAQPLLTRFRHALSVVPPEEPLFLVADPARLSQVISNLLNNAAKYTPPGGRVRLSVEREGDEAVLRVRDTGIGIDAELLPHVFDLFVQGHDAPEHARGGLGIGLSLVRALVQLHGGEVGVTSGGAGAGSEFTIRLPALPQADLGLPLDPDPLDAALQSGQGRRVLVVDDNRDAAEMVAEALRQWGCEARVVTDGQAALDAAAERRPDVVLLDIGMPGMDGLEVARRLRKDPALGDVWLVALTGYGRELDHRHSREAGFDLHLTKPVELEVLQRAIAAAPKPRPLPPSSIDGPGSVGEPLRPDR